VKGETVGTSVTWKKQGFPYVIDGEVYVQSTSGNTLTIEAGTVIKFTLNSDLYVGYSDAGTLIAQGTSTDSIKFTTSAPSGNESAGDWNGIYFYAGTGSGSIMNFCTVSYAGGYSAPESGNITTDGPIAGRPTISNCKITNSAGYGIYITSGDTPTLTNNTFIGNFGADTNP
jgi:parallel beta-helix repeat protein